MREALGIKPGDPVAYALVDGEIHIRKAEDPYAHYGSVARQVMRWVEEQRAKPAAAPVAVAAQIPQPPVPSRPLSAAAAARQAEVLARLNEGRGE